ncbi:AAA family ATPase [Methanobrevibacter oralis]|uniref:AAA family ATPase n=1 Tax=Methanobrevibacter oralis TaxID=66851 RepID=UPI000A5BA11B|nr:AAA family ATPase [Methanobrevibacter oralis]
MKNEDVERYLINVLKNTPKIVKDNLTYNNQILNKRIDFYELKKYIDTFLKNESDNRFFILPGLRGVGKTTILYQLYDYLTDNCKINKNQILYLNLDRLKDFGDLDILKFLDIFTKNINEESYLENKPLFIFVDESQYTHNWALVGKIIYDEMKNVLSFKKLIFNGEINELEKIEKNFILNVLMELKRDPKKNGNISFNMVNFRLL